MAVYRRQYQPYAGSLTSERWRFLVLPRYAILELLGSRPLLIFLLFTMLPILAEGVIIYLSHSAAARALLGIAKLGDFALVDTKFFASALSTQCFFGFILAAWVGPSLVAADLANGALPLYLSRPFSRAEYALGKAMVLVGLLSFVTWVPCLLLYALNCAFAESGWGPSHLRIAFALIAGSLTWISVVTLFLLALSAWIKWRLAASAMLFGLYFVGAGIGETLAVVLRVSWGRIFNASHLFDVIWAQLLGTPHNHHGVPPLAAWLALCGLCGLSLVVLNRRLRARDVVR
jgi:ABC-type transport system involved in multi-copper enzyme maturation permease subunit